MFSSAAANTLLSFAKEGFAWYKDKRELLGKIKESDEIKAVIALHKEYLATIPVQVKDLPESKNDFLPPIFVRVEGDEAKDTPADKPMFRPYLSQTVLDNLDVAKLSPAEDDNPDLGPYKEAISDAIKKLLSFFQERIKPSCLKNFLHDRDQSAYIASDTESTVYCYLLFFLSENFIKFSGGQTDISCLARLESFVRKYIELHPKKHELVKHLTQVCLCLKRAIFELKKHNFLLEFESRVKKLLNCSAHAAERMLINLAQLFKQHHDEIVTVTGLAEEKQNQSQLLDSIIQCARYYKKLRKDPIEMDFSKMADKKPTDVFGKQQNFLTGLPGQKHLEQAAGVCQHLLPSVFMLISVRDLAQCLWNDRTQLVMHYEENFPHLSPVFQTLEQLNKNLSEDKMASLLAFREMDEQYIQHGIIAVGDFGKDTEEILRYVESNVIESLNSIINKYRFYPKGALATEMNAQAKALVLFANRIASMHHIKIDARENNKTSSATHSHKLFKSASANSVPEPLQQVGEHGLTYV